MPDIEKVPSGDLGLKRQRRMFSFLVSKEVPPVPYEDERKFYPPLWRLKNIFLTWVFPLVGLGYIRTLQPQDLFKLPKNMTVDELQKEFQAYFNKVNEVAKQKHLRKNPNKEYTLTLSVILKSLCLQFKYQLLLVVLFQFINMGETPVIPIISKKLIEFVSLKAEDPDTPIGPGVGWACLLTFLLLLLSLSFNCSFYVIGIVGKQITAILTKLVLEKAFRIDSRSKHQFPHSKLSSFVGSDLPKIERGILVGSQLAMVLPALAGCIVVLVINLRLPSLVSLGALLVACGFVIGCLTFMYKFRSKSLKFTDQRVAKTKEIISNMKHLKFYCWENPYLKALSSVRLNESRNLKLLQYFANIGYGVFFSTTPLASMFTFITLFYTSPSRTNPAIVFSSIQVISTVGEIFSVLPLVVQMVLDAYISFNRLVQFLGSSELVEDELSKIYKYESPGDGETVIEVDSAEFSWEVFPPLEDKPNKKDKKKKKTVEPLPIPEYGFTLKDINLNIKKNEFVMIVGVVGSGKSSLLQALSAKMKRLSGLLEIRGCPVLCSTPWVLSGTVEDNIVFEGEYDEKRYLQTLYACSLDEDLKTFPQGDHTEVGENGITLSGGQKARVSLARSVYANQDIYLLDDVLSAVDAKVGDHIMNSCFLGLLKDKTRVLATHQLSYLKFADSIIFMNKNGTISQGTVEQLKENNEDFRALLLHKDRDGKEVTSENPRSSIEKDHDVIEEVIDSSNGKLIKEEVSKVNSVPWKVYHDLLSLGSGNIPTLIYVAMLIFAFALTVFSILFATVWLSFWTANKFPDKTTNFYVAIYITITFLSLFLLIISFSITSRLIINSSSQNSINAIKSLLHVPMSFIDSTPTGRILNRFTKDIDSLDNDLVESGRSAIYLLSYNFGVLILVMIYLPWTAILMPFISLVLVITGSFYISSSRELKRLESTRRSFVLNIINECLDGVEVIRGYGKTNIFFQKCNTFLNNTTEASLLVLAIQRWAHVVVTMSMMTYVFLINMLSVDRQFNISPSSAGLAISFINVFPEMLSLLLKYSVLVENDMTCFERVHEYAYELPQEAAYTRNDTAPAPEWPENGEIVFNNVSMRYREGLPMSLKNVSINIKANERVGICGRTGAGKSSMISTLFRLTELAEGNITIDGVNTSDLGLYELRSKLSIIPQESVLFGGTIRKNLDPFAAESDDVLWNALKRTQLIAEAEFEQVKQQKGEKLHKFHLDALVEIDGTNFSSGEKQLISFARALIKRSKILLLDEATSSVDYQTDAKVQQIIVQEFSNCTILCIAHRLRTILHYDKILVLDHGELKEFDTPYNLFMDKLSIFRQLLDKSNITIDDF